MSRMPMLRDSVTGAEVPAPILRVLATLCQGAIQRSPRARGMFNCQEGRPVRCHVRRGHIFVLTGLVGGYWAIEADKLLPEGAPFHPAYANLFISFDRGRWSLGVPSKDHPTVKQYTRNPAVQSILAAAASFFDPRFPVQHVSNQAIDAAVWILIAGAGQEYSKTADILTGETQKEPLQLKVVP